MIPEWDYERVDMGNLQRTVYGDLALMYLNAANPPVVRNQRGYVSALPTRNGAGDYTLTLATDNGVAQNNSFFTATCMAAAPGAIGVEFLTTTTHRVRTFSLTVVPAIAAADIDFVLTIGEFSPS
jgi:hypothetical protein